MMKKFVLAGLAFGAGLASPALALEHEVVIDHAAGPIAADYRGAIKVETKQVGAAGVAGRPSTLRCQWTASLDVERVAKVGTVLNSRRTLSSDDVAGGSRPGWCPTAPEALDNLVDARSDKVRAALMALVEKDRAALVAEADTATNRG
ncbi:hypothetical protein [Erythrobacter sp. WG]|uniref:hypothetical protein n=1 Tax=Erythrobacter sp. WG TaxID=2985510 RepID=UPI002271664C|nr:hypothetical protein [Erythrobacter sp. WG]MCX9148538.1 hypothetical protein [Erythrobacter sp. WG]